MGLFDKMKKTARLEQLENDIKKLKIHKRKLEKEIAEITLKRDSNEVSEIENLSEKIACLNDEKLMKSKQVEELDKIIKQKSGCIDSIDEQITFQDLGLGASNIILMSSQSYRQRLESVRELERQMVIESTACEFPKEAYRSLTDTIKQLIRSFNGECDFGIDKLRYNNHEAIRKRILTAFDSLNRLHAPQAVALSTQYRDLKLEELLIFQEYLEQKQEEKVQARMIREQQREDEKLRREIDQQRLSYQREQTQYLNLIGLLNKQIELASDDIERESFAPKLNQAKLALERLKAAIEALDFRENEPRAGYVYILSNIGSFGEGVYKVGMTRRLEPGDLVDELSGEALPFPYDVHCICYADDAEGLLSSICSGFDEMRLNLANYQKRFFRVPLEQLCQSIEEYLGHDIDYVTNAYAEEYRRTLSYRKEALSEAEAMETAVLT